MADADGGGDQLDRSAVDELLGAATQDEQLRPVVARLLECPDQLTVDGQSRLDEVVAAVGALDESVVVERNRLLDLLDRDDVDAQFDVGDLGDRPLHVMFFGVDGAAIDRTVATFESAGYRRLAPTGDAQWRGFRATQGGCGFVRTDRQPFRIELRWTAGRFASGRLSRLITPNAADFEAIDLPQSLWAGYSLVHLTRLPGRFVRRRAEPANLGPFLQTPDALIEPLLRFADLQSDELLIDLGCGDGRIPIAAATRFGSRARGVEYDAELVERAQRAIAASSVADLVEVVLGDASTAALDDAGVVVAFLPVGTLTALVPEVLSRLRPGARLVVHEQERLDVTPAADVQAPLISAGGVTVAHRWNR
jgi:hypothetical protein